MEMKGMRTSMTIGDYGRLAKDRSIANSRPTHILSNGEEIMCRSDLPTELENRGFWVVATYVDGVRQQ